MQNDNITFCLPIQSIQYILGNTTFVAVAILLLSVAKYQVNDSHKDNLYIFDKVFTQQYIFIFKFY